MSENGDSLGASFDDYGRLSRIACAVALAKLPNDKPCPFCHSHAMPMHEKDCIKLDAEDLYRSHVTSP